MELLDLLRELREQGGSDLHLVADSVPRLRVDGHLRPMKAAMLTRQDLSRFTESLLTEEQQRQLAKSGEWDGAHTVPVVGRFRFHLYAQRGSLAMAVRAVSDSVPSLEELGLPRCCERVDAKISGTCSGNRSDGEWEKHHAGSHVGSGESRTAGPYCFT